MTVDTIDAAPDRPGRRVRAGAEAPGNDHSITIRIPDTHYRLYKCLSTLNALSVAEIVAASAEHGIKDMIAKTLQSLDQNRSAKTE